MKVFPGKGKERKKILLFVPICPSGFFATLPPISPYISPLYHLSSLRMYIFPPQAFFYSLRCQYGNRPLSFPIGKAIRSSSPFSLSRGGGDDEDEGQDKHNKKKERKGLFIFVAIRRLLLRLRLRAPVIRVPLL